MAGSGSGSGSWGGVGSLTGVCGLGSGVLAFCFNLIQNIIQLSDFYKIIVSNIFCLIILIFAIVVQKSKFKISKSIIAEHSIKVIVFFFE